MTHRLEWNLISFMVVSEPHSVYYGAKRALLSQKYSSLCMSLDLSILLLSSLTRCAALPWDLFLSSFLT